MRTVIATACVAVALGIGVAGCDPVGTASPSPSSAPSTTDGPSPAPTPSVVAQGPPASAPIPDSAFFTPPRERTREAPPKPDTGAGKLPSFCGAASPIMKPVQARNRHLIYTGVNAPVENIPDGTVGQTIATYNGAGAGQVLARFRTAVANCPTEKLDSGATVDYKELPPYAVGDESVVIQRTWHRPHGSEDQPMMPLQQVELLAVVRIQNTVTYLVVDGWETIDADSDVTRDYTKLAADAVQNWRNS
jgi:hypothetical protein